MAGALFNWFVYYILFYQGSQGGIAIMPGFADQLSLERLGLILQFAGGLLLLEGIFSDQVVSGLEKAFNRVRKWLSMYGVLLVPLALILGFAAFLYSAVRLSDEAGIPWGPESWGDQWDYMWENPGRYWGMFGISMGICLGVLAAVLLLLWLVYEVSAMLSRARRIKRTALVVGIILIVCGFVACYAATL